jgi:CheY-like chemotaxis protein/anti-sigma regulatory factor (Ser/Thr protein kinase)
MLKPLADDKGLALLMELDNEAPPYINTDKARFEQVLINLLGNAIKFTQKGEVKLHVQCNQAESGAELKVTVLDTGIGIAKQDHAQVFEAFKQADGSTTRRYDGTGLGLSLCKQLLTLMGGKIELTSELGVGTNITFYLPVSIAQPPSEVTQGDRPINKTLTGHILLVEDNEVNLTVVRAMLEKMALSVTIAKDGQQAIDALTMQSFDAVLMDVHMPNMDGLEATKQIRKNPAYQNLPIIAFTANIFKEDIGACYSAGMDDFVSKPVDQAQLREVLSRWLVC